MWWLVLFIGITLAERMNFFNATPLAVTHSHMYYEELEVRFYSTEKETILEVETYEEKCYVLYEKCERGEYEVARIEHTCQKIVLDKKRRFLDDLLTNVNDFINTCLKSQHWFILDFSNFYGSKIFKVKIKIDPL